MAGLIKSLAVELGPKGIRAVGVAPTLTETPGVASKRTEGEAVNEALVRYAQALPLGRLGVPDDIARVVLFAASDLGAFVSGSVIPVDGGDWPVETAGVPMLMAGGPPRAQAAALFQT